MARGRVVHGEPRGSIFASTLLLVLAAFQVTILIDDIDHLCLTDFGLSHFTDAGQTTMGVLVPGAQERIDG